MTYLGSPLIALILLLTGIALWWYTRERIGYTTFPNELMRRSAQTPLPLSVLWTLRILIITVASAIILEPALSVERSVSVSSGGNIVILLDLSQSMLADDLPPSRLERAKEVLIDLLSESSSDRYSLIIFAGKPYILASDTPDRTWLKAIIRDLSVESIRQYLPGRSGTAIGDALLLGGSLLTSASGALVLITDGRANIWVDPKLAIEPLIPLSIPVYAVGIGARSGATLSYLDDRWVRQEFRDAEGRPVLADVDMPTLQEISEKTGGIARQATDPTVLREILADIRSRVQSPERTEMRLVPLPLAPLLWIVLVVLVSLHGLLARGVRYRYRN